jgi:AcrR family transcriptional regulator
MPKAFTEREKAIIRAKLLAKGKELFSSYGLKKTNVEELTEAVGISKGAFYLFYDSKEALFFEIVRQFEAEYRDQILRDLARTNLAPRQRFREMLHGVLILWKENPLFGHFGNDEYEYLVRKLPEEQIQAHLQSDVEFSTQFIEACRRAGMAIEAEPKLVTGLMRAVVFLTLHEEDIGRDVHADVLTILIDQIAEYLVKEQGTS